jgi:hypothetical protein
VHLAALYEKSLLLVVPAEDPESEGVGWLFELFWFELFPDFDVRGWVVSSESLGRRLDAHTFGGLLITQTQLEVVWHVEMLHAYYFNSIFELVQIIILYTQPSNQSDSLIFTAKFTHFHSYIKQTSYSKYFISFSCLLDLLINVSSHSSSLSSYQPSSGSSSSTSSTLATCPQYPLSTNSSSSSS